MKNDHLLLVFVLTCACSDANALDWWNPVNPADFESESPISGYVHGLSASTFAPVQRLSSDNWDIYSPASGKNFALANARAGVNASHNGWNIGAVYRQDWFAEVNRDTLDLYRSQRSGPVLPANATYLVDYALEGFEARGVSIGKSAQIRQSGHVLKLGANATLLDAQRGKIQKASGIGSTGAFNALTLSGSTFNDDTTTNTSAESFNAGLRNQTPSGIGYSIDFGLRYEGPSGLQVQWAVTDALSEIYWTQVPEVTLAGASTFNGTFPGGHKILRNFIQSMAPKHYIEASLPFQNFKIEVSDNIQGPLSIISLGIQHEIGASVRVNYDYDFTFRTVGLSLLYPSFTFQLRTDNLKADAARALMLQLNFHASY